MLKSIIAFLQFLDRRREEKLERRTQMDREYIRSLERRIRYTEDMLVDEHGSGSVLCPNEKRQAEIDRHVAMIVMERRSSINFTEAFNRRR